MTDRLTDEQVANLRYSALEWERAAGDELATLRALLNGGPDGPGVIERLEAIYGAGSKDWRRVALAAVIALLRQHGGQT